MGFTINVIINGGEIMAKLKLSKEVIIKASVELVKNENLRSVNIPRVAILLHVMPQTVYRHFPSKSHLILATIQNIWKSRFDDIQYSEIISFTDCMQVVFDALISILDDYPMFFEMHMNAFPKNCPFQLRDYKNEIVETIIQGMVKVLKNDKKVNRSCFSERLDEETFVWLVYNKMIIRFMERKTTCNKLKEGIGKILYRIEE